MSYRSNDGELWGYKEEADARNDSLTEEQQQEQPQPPPDDFQDIPKEDFPI